MLNLNVSEDISLLNAFLFTHKKKTKQVNFFVIKADAPFLNSAFYLFSTPGSI